MFNWFKPKVDQEKELLKQELMKAEQALIWLSEDMFKVYPQIAKVRKSTAYSLPNAVKRFTSLSYAAINKGYRAGRTDDLLHDPLTGFKGYCKILDKS